MKSRRRQLSNGHGFGRWLGSRALALNVHSHKERDLRMKAVLPTISEETRPVVKATLPTVLR